MQERKLGYLKDNILYQGITMERKEWDFKSMTFDEVLAAANKIDAIGFPEGYEGVVEYEKCLQTYNHKSEWIECTEDEFVRTKKRDRRTIATPVPVNPEKEASTQPVEDDGFDYYYRKRMRFGEYTNWLHCSKNVYDELPEFLRMKKLKTDKQVVKESETFEDYMRNSRDEFVGFINAFEWRTDLRTHVEDLLICFDQMREKILGQPVEKSADYVEDLQDQVRRQIKEHDLFDWHEALTENEMIYLENLLLTFCPIFPKGSIGYEKQNKPTSALPDKQESKEITRDYEKAALAWMKAQAKALSNEVQDDWGPFYLACVISAHIEPSKETGQREAISFLLWAIDSRFDWNRATRKFIAAWDNYKEYTPAELYQQFLNRPGIQPSDIK